jgi:5-aminolevulinate synthase
MVGDPMRCRALTDLLMEQHHIYVQPINYPTVPRGTERVRITPNPLHSAEDVTALVSALNEVWQDIALPVAA